MTVYKLCWRIILANASSMLLYIALFLGVSLIMMMSAPAPDVAGFRQSRITMAFITEEDTALTRALREHLGRYAVFESVENREESIVDAVFSGLVQYVLYVPKGFSAAFWQGEDANLVTHAAPGPAQASYAELAVNGFLQTAFRYRSMLPAAEESAILARTMDDLLVEARVRTEQAPTRSAMRFDPRVFVNYLAYSLVAILMIGIGSNVMLFQQPDIRRRNGCAPVTPRRFIWRVFIGNGIYGVIVWAVFFAVCLFLMRNYIQLDHTLLYAGNTLTLVFWSACMGLLVGQSARTRNVIIGFTTVFSLATSFLSGVFVPQELLGSAILSVARFTPTYWYVSANNRIAALASTDWSTLAGIAGDGALQIGFGVMFLTISMVIAKQRRATSGA